jgi:hypothetical protein
VDHAHSSGEERAAKCERKFLLDVTSGVDRKFLNPGTFESAIIDVFKAAGGSTGCTDRLVDIGEVIGNHRAPLAGAFRQVIAREPNLLIFKILWASVLRNNTRNASRHDFGLTEHGFSANLIAASDNHSLGKAKRHCEQGHSISAKARLTSSMRFDLSRLAVPCPILRHECQDFLEIGVEGTEQKTIGQSPQFVRIDAPALGTQWGVREPPGIKEFIGPPPSFATDALDSNDSQATSYSRRPTMCCMVIA